MRPGGLLVKEKLLCRFVSDSAQELLYPFLGHKDDISRIKFGAFD